MTQTNEPTIAAMNEVIAQFRGYKKREKLYPTDRQILEGEGLPNWYEDSLKYHTSWDWLMPVVIRIKNDESLRLRVPCNGISDSIWPYINATKYMNQRLLRADITGTHEGVYQFIQWYQQQKQSNG